MINPPIPIHFFLPGKVKQAGGITEAEVIIESMAQPVFIICECGKLLMA
jgi:hypothetical protein